MRRWSAVGLVATLSACGGAHEVGQTSVEHSRNATPPGQPVAHVERAPANPTSDATPELITVAGTQRTPPPATPAPTPAVAPGAAMPPSGGYIVRSTSGGTPAARPPAPTTVATVSRETESGTDGERYAPAEPAAAPVRGPSGRGHASRRSAAGSAAAAADSSAYASLSGASVGGGGRGEGTVGLGTRGSMGHGSGAGVGSGYGSGAGRIAVAPAASSTPAGYAPPRPVAQMPPPPPPPSVAPATTTTTTTVTIGVTTTTTEVDEVQAQAEAGRLTAASVGDSDRRDNYLEYLARHEGEAEVLGLDMSRRVRFRVVDANGAAVSAARLSVQGDGATFAGVSHADGYWDFYPSVFGAAFNGAIAVRAEVEGVGTQATVQVPARGDAQGPVELRIPAVVQAPPPALDLGFAIDVTGSMGDELRYVNTEIGSIVRRIEAQAPGVRIRVGATFYRDRGDEVQVQQIPFTTNVAGFAAAMQGVEASGGGDYPEDMNAGLEVAMTRMAWTEGPAVRALVVIADAPPQRYADEQYTYRQAMLDASRRGIRLLPVAASGADRTTEYLFRAMGAFTSTPYVYLTDDSGVGGAHMEADTDRVAVERFNDLLSRLVVSDLAGNGMHEPVPLGPAT